MASGISPERCQASITLIFEKDSPYRSRADASYQALCDFTKCPNRGNRITKYHGDGVSPDQAKQNANNNVQTNFLSECPFRFG